MIVRYQELKEALSAAESSSHLFQKRWSDVAKETKFALNRLEAKKPALEEVVLGTLRSDERNQGTHMLQSPLFRLAAPRQGGGASAYPPEIFEDQYLLFFANRKAQED